MYGLYMYYAPVRACHPEYDVSVCVCSCECVYACVSMQVYRLYERWALTTGRPPCPLAISVPCLPWRRLCNDLGDRDRSLFVVSISHNWALVPEGQVYRIRTGLHNTEKHRHTFDVKQGMCVCLRLRAAIDFRQQISSCAEVDSHFSSKRYVVC